jgi:hypothetical protein
VSSFAKRYGVDPYTAYDDLTALGAALPEFARQWAERPSATPPRTVGQEANQPRDTCWIMLDGKPFFAAWLHLWRSVLRHLRARDART